MIRHINTIDFLLYVVYFKRHMYVEVTFLYVTLFSSNICMLVIYLFYVTQQTYIYYCSPSHMLFKKTHNMHMFFLWYAACHH